MVVRTNDTEPEFYSDIDYGLTYSTTSLENLQALVGLGSAIASAAAPAVAAIGLSAMFIGWINKVYQQTYVQHKRF